MTEVFLRRLSRWQAEQQREAIADVYVEAFRRVAGGEYRDRREFLRRFAEDVQRPGFDMMIASHARPAGCAYGHLVDRGGGWWEGFRGGVPWDVEELTASGRVFAVAGLMVLPSHRRQRVATRLVEHLLTRSGADLVTALVEPANEPALSMFRAWGWTRTGEVKTGAEGPLYEAWSRQLTK